MGPGALDARPPAPIEDRRVEIRRSAGLVSFWIHVSPRAARERVGGEHGGALRVAVREPPVEGAANEACVRVLARALGVQRAAVDLDPGARGRRKPVRVAGEPERLEAVLRRLAAMAEESAVR
jgi:uncharacterized protein (TIGR00251 family)